MSAMNQQYIEDNHLVDRYVQHKLSDQERDDFEIFMLEHPDVADKVELALAMRKELKRQSGALSDDELSRRRETPKRSFDRIWAAAATVLLGASVVWNLNTGGGFSDEPYVLPSTVWLEGSRGIEENVSIGNAEDRFPINIDVAGLNLTELLNVVLISEDAQTEWEIGDLRADEDGVISLLIPALEPSATYTVVVSYESTKERALEYKLRTDQ